MRGHLNHIEIRWKNFKSFEDTKWIKIKPITIILGPNNVGKTNLIAPLVLMNQTMNSRDSTSPLIISGRAINGGNYKDIVHGYDETKEIYFGLRYHIFEQSDELGEEGPYPPGAFEITLGRNNDDLTKIELKKLSVFDVYKKKFFSLTKRKLGGFNYSGIGGKESTKKERAAIRKSRPLNFVFSPNSILYSYDMDDIDKNDASDGGFSKGFSNILSAIAFNYSQARRYLGQLSFIGPLREPPKRIYEISTESQFSVGIKGENMASLLKQIGNKNKELNSWIKKFGFGDEIRIEQVYSNYYAINFYDKGNDTPTSLHNTGFGVSQILPLIIQTLTTKGSSITIAEQPEIHLNPKLQSVLAELLVEMTKNDQTVIVETHSEHILLRLRTLIAKKKISHEDVALYFIDKKNNNSEIKEIKIEKDGHIKNEEWPKDFFEDSLNESIDLANEQFSFSNN